MSAKRRILSALWFLLLVAYLDRVAISFAGPTMMKSMSMSAPQFGIVLSAFGIGHLVAQLPGGMIADRWGAKLMLVAGPLLWAIFTGSTALVATVLGLCVVRALLGVSEGLFATSTSKAIGENFSSRQRARALSIFSTAIPLAPAFAGPLIGKLVSGYGWHVMFVIVAAPSVLAALICLLLLPERPPAASINDGCASHDSIPFTSVLKLPSLWIASLGGFAFTTANWGYSGWMPSYLALERHINLQRLGPISSVPYLFGLFGILLGGWLASSRLYHRRLELITGSCLGAGLSLLAAYKASSLPMSLAGLCGAATFLFCIQPTLSSVILDLAPRHFRASYQGVFNTVVQLGGIVAPATIGFLVGATGTFAAGFALMIAALCGSAACILALAPFLEKSLMPDASRVFFKAPRLRH